MWGRVRTYSHYCQLRMALRACCAQTMMLVLAVLPTTTAAQSVPGDLLTGGNSPVDADPGIGIPYAYAETASKSHSEVNAYDLGGDGNRVIVHNGSFVHEVTDFRVPGRGMDFVWARIYRSEVAYNGSVGMNWQHNYNQFLVKYRPPVGSTEELIAFRNGFGRSMAFKKVGFEYVGPENVASVLTKNADGTFRLTMKDGERRTFAAPGIATIGQLLRIEDRCGNTITLSYNATTHRLASITDTLGRTYSLTYFDSGRVKSISDDEGRKWWYGYSAANDLQVVVTPSPDGVVNAYGNVTQYTYNPQHGMLQATYPEGVRFTNTYYPNLYNVLKRHTRGDGFWTFKYLIWTFGLYYPPDAGGSYVGPPGNRLVVEITDRNGNDTTQVIGSSENLMWVDEHMNRSISSASEALERTYYEYEEDALGEGSDVDRLIRTSPEGRNLASLIDAHGDIIEERRTPNSTAMGEEDIVIRTVREPQFHLPVVTVGPEAFPVGTVPLDSSGKLDLTDELVNSYATHYVYDMDEESEDINGDGVTNQAHGKVIRITLPTVTLFAAAFGPAIPDQPARRLYSYNDVGQMLEEVDEEDVVTRYFYWPASDPSGATSPWSSITTSRTEPGGYLAKTVRNYEGEQEITTTFKYDRRGNVVESVDPNGHVTRYIYDWLDRRLSEKQLAADGVTVLRGTEWEYDGNGNVIAKHELNLLEDGSPIAALPVIDTIHEYDAIDQLTKSRTEVRTDEFLEVRHFYDKNQNEVLTLSPRSTASSSAWHEPSAVVSRVFDENDRVHSESRGGVTSQFAGLAAHAHINLTAIGLVAPFPDLESVTYEYDSDGCLSRVLDQRNKATMLSVDGHGRLSTITDAEGITKKRSYDIADRVGIEEIIDADQSTVDQLDRFFDERGQIIEERRHAVGGSGSDSVESFMYDRRGRQVRKRNTRGVEVHTVYDAAGCIDSVATAAAHQMDYDYDASSNLLTVTERDDLDVISESTFTYDTLHRRRTAEDAYGGTITNAYDSRGNPVQITDERGFVVRQEYDGLGKLVGRSTETIAGSLQSGQAAGYWDEEWTVDENGNPRAATDGEGHEVHVGYDALDRGVALGIGGSTAATTEYYPGGAVHVEHDANGSVTTVTLDDAMYPVQAVRTPASGVAGGVMTESYGWTASGGLGMGDSQTADGTVHFERDFNGMGRLVTEEVSGTSLGTYLTQQDLDADSNLIGMTYPSGLLISAEPAPYHDALGTVVGPNGVSIDYVYDGGGRLMTRQTTTATGKTWILDRDYDNAARLFHETVSSVVGSPGPSMAALDVSYELDARGQRLTETDQLSGVISHFTYDGAGQIHQVAVAVPQQTTPPSIAVGASEYVFDQAGNRTVVVTLGVAKTYSCSPGSNRYSQVGGASYTYDSNGALTSDGTYQYWYNATGRLVECRNGTGAVVSKYTYDVLGRRVITELPGDRRIVDVWYDRRVVERLIDLGCNGTVDVTCEFVYGNELDEVLWFRRNGVNIYPIANAAGSTVALLSDDGAILESYAYDAFGAPKISTPALPGVQHAASTYDYPFLFHGQQWDGTVKMYYMRARYYRPDIGRFITIDPAGAANGLNLYTFCENDPVNRRDPTGLGSPDVHRAVTFAAAYQLERQQQREYYEAKGIAPDQIPADQNLRNGAVAVAHASEIAQLVVNVDHWPGSQSRALAHWHGMSPMFSGEERAESWSQFSTYVSREAGSGSVLGLAKALHAVQDIVCGGHNLKKYPGEWPFYVGQVLATAFELGTLGLAPGSPHWVDDVVPTQCEVNLMTGLSTLILSGDTDLALDCLDVLLGIEGGAEGTVEVQKNGDIVFEFNDGRQVTMTAEGVIVEAVAEEADVKARDEEETNDWALLGYVCVFPAFIADQVEGVEVVYDPSDRRIGE